MDKIPCIKCDNKLWDKIKPYLIKWGYEVDKVYDINIYPLLVINEDGKLGKCNNFMKFAVVDEFNRELVNIEEFLYRAAILKGYSYKNGLQDIQNIINISQNKIKFFNIYYISTIYVYDDGKEEQDDDLTLFYASYDAAAETIKSFKSTGSKIPGIKEVKYEIHPKMIETYI